MALTLGQFQKQVQRLVMTPQMQQSIKLLQLNAMELEQLTEQQMLENPFLELGDDQDSSTQTSPPPSGASEGGTASLPEQNPANPRDLNSEAEEARGKDMEKEPEAFDRVDADWEEIYEDAENKVYYQKEDYEQ